MTNESETINKRRGRGIGTVIACFAVAVVIAAVWDDDDTPGPSVSVVLADDDAKDDSPTDGRLVYKINKGHVVVTSSDGAARVDVPDAMKSRVQVDTAGGRTTITVDDEEKSDDPIRIHMPKAERCRVELAAGLLRVEGLPCNETDLTVRSGKMEVDDVPKTHGVLSGEVSVGTVRIDGGDGNDKRSSGVGNLRAEAPATGVGPGLKARVDVGMLTVEVD